MHRYQASPGVYVQRPEKDEIDKQFYTPEEVVKDLEEQVQKYFDIHKAAYFNKLRELEQLLSKGSDPNERESDSGDTPIILAAKNGNDRIVSLLCNSGGDVKVAGLGGLTALHHACTNDNMLAIQILLKAGANANAVDDSGNSPLHYCCQRGHLRVADALLEAGADSNHKNANHVTPMMAAVLHSHPVVLDALLKHDATVDAKDVQGHTALHYAAVLGYVRIVRQLLIAGADVHIKNEHGQTASEIAITEGIRTLIESVAAGATLRPDSASAFAKRPRSAIKSSDSQVPPNDVKTELLR